MKRLYFLVPTLKIAQDITSELSEVGVSDEKIHIVGGSPEICYMEHLHMASVVQTSDLVPAMRRGLYMGIGLSVLLLILFSVFLIPANIHIHPLALVAMLFFGIGFGVWANGLIGIGIQNPIVEKYEDYVKEGHLLMMVDSPDGRENELTTRIVRHHPGAEIAIKPAH